MENQLVVAQSVIISGICAFFQGCIASSPLVWCLIFTAFFPGYSTNWLELLFAWGTVGSFIISACFSFLKVKVTNWMLFSAAFISVILTCVIATIQNFPYFQVHWIIALVFLVNLILLCIWSPITYIRVSMCDVEFRMLFEIGWISFVLLYHVMIFEKYTFLNIFYIPFVVILIIGLQSILYFRKCKLFLYALNMRKNIYIMNGRYCIYSYKQVVTLLWPELLCLLFVIISMSVVVALFYTYNLYYFFGSTFYTIFFYGGVFMGGLYHQSRWIFLLHLILSCVLVVFMALKPIYSKWSIPQLGGIFCFCVVSSMCCLLTRMHNKLQKSINGSQFVFLLSGLCNVIFCVILMIIDK